MTENSHSAIDICVSQLEINNMKYVKNILKRIFFRINIYIQFLVNSSLKLIFEFY